VLAFWQCASYCAIQHTHTQPFNGILSGTTRVGRYQKKRSPTHTHPDHLTSFINFSHLLRSILHSILFVQFTCLTVLFGNLSPGPLWSSSWSWILYFMLRAFLHPVIIFFMPSESSDILFVPCGQFSFLLHRVIRSILITFRLYRPSEMNNCTVPPAAMQDEKFHRPCLETCVKSVLLLCTDIFMLMLDFSNSML